MIVSGRISKDQAWARRLRDAKASRDRFLGDWRRNRRLLFAGFKKNPSYFVKDGWNAYQTLIGAIFAQTPSPVVRETKAVLQNTAALLTAVTQQLYEQMNTRYVTRLCVQDVFWAGFGVAMTELGQKVGVDGKPKNQVFSMSRRHPESVLFDPNAVDPNLSDHRWIAFEFYPTEKELKEDKDYNVNASVLDKLQPVKGAPQAWVKNEPRDGGPAVTGEENAPEFRQFRVMEIWDRENRRVLYQPTGDDFLIGEKDWPVEPVYRGQLLFPCNLLYFTENPDEFWPVPEMTMISEEISQRSILDRQILMDAVTKFRVFLAKVNLLQKGHIDRLISGGSKPRVIGIDSTQIPGGNVEGLDLRQVIHAIEEPTVKQDVAGVSIAKQQQIHETIGAGDFASAGFRSTRSATEAAALSDFLRSRMTTRTENMDAFFKRQTRLLVLFLQETATEERMAKMTDQTGVDVWRQFSADDIQGDFDFDVIAGSSLPRNTDSVRERNLQFFQQTAPVIANAGGDLFPWVEWLAPFFDVPQHRLDQLRSGHKQVLKKLATAFTAAAGGAQVPGQAFVELSAAAVNTGLSKADLAEVAQTVAKMLASNPPGAGGGPPAGAAMRPGGPPQIPGGLPGTNPSDQTS